MLLASGLILVPWVAAFGVGGRTVRRLPTRVGPILAWLERLLLAGALTWRACRSLVRCRRI